MALPATSGAGGAYLLSLDALTDLDAALATFAGNAAQALAAMRRDFQHRSAILAAREEAAIREVNHWLAVCESAGDEDAAEAYRALEAARERLDRIRRWQARVGEASSHFHAAAAGGDRVVRETVPGGRAHLQAKLEELRAYHAVQLDPGGAPRAQIAAPAPGAPPPTARAQLPEVQRLADLRLPRGYVWVPLAAIDSGPRAQVQPETDFRDVSYDTMLAGLQRLRVEVLPLVHQAPDTTHRDTFRELDGAAGQDYEHGLQRLYEVFFGNDFVYLERRRGQEKFDIASGRHRIRVARDLGWDAIPAQIKDLNP